MKITPITSQANPLVKQVRGLQRRSRREKSGLFLIESAKLIREAFDQGIQIEDIVVSQSFLKAGLGESHALDVRSLNVVDDRLFKELSTTETPAGILAVARMPGCLLESLFPPGKALVVIAEAIQDPGNLGTMMRTALAAGATGMILTTGTVDAYNPKVVRSASGALFLLPLLRDVPGDEAVRMVKERGLTVIACDPEAEKPFWELDLTQPVALVFGNEGQGFDRSMLALADEVVSIPMSPESESLNVAVSAGIILFRAGEQRAKSRSKNATASQQ